MKETFSKSLDLYFCGREKCKKSHFFGPAIRTHYLLHFVIKGKGFYEVNGKKYYLKKGEGFLIKPSELTFYQADKNDPWEYMWVAFDGYEVSTLLKNCNINYTMVSNNYDKFLSNFENLLLSVETPNANIYEQYSFFYSMISQLVQKNESVTDSFEKIYFEKARDYIHNNYMYGISIENIAKYVGIDRTYLYKIFISKSKQSPKNFLDNIKISSAKNMLSQNKFTLTQIALSCGFIDSSALCKHFKKATGKTTKEFIRDINCQISKD